MKERMVFVLLESGSSAPVAVFKEPGRPFLLPQDAVEKRDRSDQAHVCHKEVVGEWRSESFGTVFSLVAYAVLSGAG
jgi:hypothetical protein